MKLVAQLFLVWMNITNRSRELYQNGNSFTQIARASQSWSRIYVNILSSLRTVTSILSKVFWRQIQNFWLFLRAKSYEYGARRVFSWCYQDTPLFDVFINAGFIPTGEFPDFEAGKIVQRFYKDLDPHRSVLNYVTYSKISISEECDADYTEENVSELLANPDSFGIFIQDTKDKSIKGGVMGSIYMAETKGIPCGNIDFLWVEDSLRKGDTQNKGLGKILMEEAETLFRQQGAKYAQTATWSFQAPEFYKKLGYIIARSCPGHLLLKDGPTDTLECTKKL